MVINDFSSMCESGLRLLKAHGVDLSENSRQPRVSVRVVKQQINAGKLRTGHPGVFEWCVAVRDTRRTGA